MEQITLLESNIPEKLQKAINECLDFKNQGFPKTNEYTTATQNVMIPMGDEPIECEVTVKYPSDITVQNIDAGGMEIHGYIAPIMLAMMSEGQPVTLAAEQVKTLFDNGVSAISVKLPPEVGGMTFGASIINYFINEDGNGMYKMSAVIPGDGGKLSPAEIQCVVETTGEATTVTPFIIFSPENSNEDGGQQQSASEWHEVNYNTATRYWGLFFSRNYEDSYLLEIKHLYSDFYVRIIGNLSRFNGGNIESGTAKVIEKIGNWDTHGRELTLNGIWNNGNVPGLVLSSTSGLNGSGLMWRVSYPQKFDIRNEAQGGAAEEFLNITQSSAVGGGVTEESPSGYVPLKFGAHYKSLKVDKTKLEAAKAAYAPMAEAGKAAVFLMSPWNVSKTGMISPPNPDLTYLPPYLPIDFSPENRIYAMVPAVMLLDMVYNLSEYMSADDFHGVAILELTGGVPDHGYSPVTNWRALYCDTVIQTPVYWLGSWSGLLQGDVIDTKSGFAYWYFTDSNHYPSLPEFTALFLGELKPPEALTEDRAGSPNGVATLQIEGRLRTEQIPFLEIWENLRNNFMSTYLRSSSVIGAERRSLNSPYNNLYLPLILNYEGKKELTAFFQGFTDEIKNTIIISDANTFLTIIPHRLEVLQKRTDIFQNMTYSPTTNEAVSWAIICFGIFNGEKIVRTLDTNAFLLNYSVNIDGVWTSNYKDDREEAWSAIWVGSPWGEISIKGISPTGGIAAGYDLMQYSSVTGTYIPYNPSSPDYDASTLKFAEFDADAWGGNEFIRSVFSVGHPSLTSKEKEYTNKRIDQIYSMINIIHRKIADNSYNGVNMRRREGIFAAPFYKNYDGVYELQFSLDESLLAGDEIDIEINISSTVPMIVLNNMIFQTTKRNITLKLGELIDSRQISLIPSVNTFHINVSDKQTIEMGSQNTYGSAGAGIWFPLELTYLPLGVKFILLQTLEQGTGWNSEILQSGEVSISVAPNPYYKRDIYLIYADKNVVSGTESNPVFDHGNNLNLLIMGDNNSVGTVEFLVRRGAEEKRIYSGANFKYDIDRITIRRNS